MTTRRSHRYRKSPDRRVWLSSESNPDGRHQQIAMVLTAVGLEQARLEAEARADIECRDREDATQRDVDRFSTGEGGIHA